MDITPFDAAQPSEIAELTVQVIASVIILLFILYIYELRTFDITPVHLTEDIEDIMNNFHLDPDYDDFAFVWKHRKKLPQQSLKCWLYGVKISQPEFIEYAETAEGIIILPAEEQREVQRIIRRAQTAPTSGLLDCIWYIYFASGDRKYSDIIAAVARGAIPSSLTVRAAASYSYRKVMGVRAE